MATLRYTFRPSLFSHERTIVLDGTGIAEIAENRPDTRLPWSAIADVHIEPVAGGDDGRTRFVLRLQPKEGEPILIDSVNVRGTDDFEHRSDEFAAVISAIHQELKPYGKAVSFRYGARRGVIIAWWIALILTVATGIFGVVTSFIIEDWAMLFPSAAFAIFGVVGLGVVRGARGPRPYDPEAPEPPAAKPAPER